MDRPKRGNVRNIGIAGARPQCDRRRTSLLGWYFEVLFALRAHCGGDARDPLDQQVLTRFGQLFLQHLTRSLPGHAEVHENLFVL